MNETVQPKFGGPWDSLTGRFPVLTFSLVQAWNKKYNWGLFVAMFFPTIAYILLLYFTEQDLSNGGFYIWYYRLFFRVGLFFLTSLVALLVGTGMFRDDINDSNIYYLVTKPIRRERLYLERYVAYLIISHLIVIPGLITTHLVADLATILYDSQFNLALHLSVYNLILELTAAFIVLTGLGAVFVTTGLALNRPLLVNLIIAFGIIIEQFLLDLISNQFEPVYIGQNLVAREVKGFSNIQELSVAFQRFYPSPEISAIGGLINFVVILLLTLIIGILVSRRKEFL